MRKLYLECMSGISGDMFVAAMLDLGVDEEKLKNVLASLPIKGFDVKISRTRKMGLDVCDFDVVLDDEYDNHDNNMEYLFGHLCEHNYKDGYGVHNHNEHEQYRDEHEPHHHEHEPHHDGHEQHHDEHRGIIDIFNIIDKTELTENAKFKAKKIFTILGEAEAKAHGETLETVHFHEVGAVDSIVDIIAAAFCIDELGIEDIIVSELAEGCGTIRCAHGILPIPVPAVVNIAEKYSLKLHIANSNAELVTPTGAAIVAAIATESRLPDSFYIEKTGAGAGKRNYEVPSILRIMIINQVDKNKYIGEISQKTNEDDEGDLTVNNDMIYKLETNIDDATGENLGYVIELLMAAGARDVYYTPVFMKKNRPAYQLSVICSKEILEKMEKIIFHETTTIGIRRVLMERTVLPREIKRIDTSIGKVLVKICDVGKEKRFYPEYESVADICRKTGMSFGDAFRIISGECYGRFNE
ncbi:MAG: nickel pincer cofactor biosynthesis protein LarC [Coprococcus sp.]